jgi:hypothetical protein
MHALSSVARETFALRWRPRGDTAVALLTAVLMVGLYYANTRAQSPVFILVVFVVLTNGSSTCCSPPTTCWSSGGRG